MCPCSTRSLTCSPNKARRHRRSVVVFRLHHAPQNLHRSWKPRPRMESALLLQMLPLDLARLRHIPQRIRGGVVVCDPWGGVGRGGCGRVAAAAPLEGVRKGDQRVIFASQGVLQAGAKAPSARAQARQSGKGRRYSPAGSGCQPRRPPLSAPSRAEQASGRASHGRSAASTAAPAPPAQRSPPAPSSPPSMPRTAAQRAPAPPRPAPPPPVRNGIC